MPVINEETERLYAELKELTRRFAPIRAEYFRIDAEIKAKQDQLLLKMYPGIDPRMLNVTAE